MSQGMRLYLLVVLVLTGVALGFIVGVLITRAEAQTPDDVDIPIDTILRGDDGDTFLVATVTASPGLKCDAFLDGRNNESVHPDTDVLIQSGANFAAIFDVEAAAFNTGSTSFVTDGLIEVFIRLGPDGVSSTGFILELTCNPPTTTTSTTTTTLSPSTTSTTVVQTTTTAVATTTEPPPINGVDTGGGACSDGACDGFRLSPLQTWVLIPAMFVLSVGLAGALTVAIWRSDG